MNKTELINHIAGKTQLPKATINKVLESAMETIVMGLEKGENVQFLGFGTFRVSDRKARTGRNPQTGKEIKIAARKVARFKPGAALAAAVNKSMGKK